MKRLILWVPLALFLLFLIVVAFELHAPSERVVRSRMVGKQMPEFALRASLEGRPALSSADLRRGRPRLVNIFASWCVPCIAEAPQLMELKRRGVPIDGVAVRDRSEDVAAFLARHGDPFERIGADPNSQLLMALGSSGVPETFIVDGSGIIRHQHLGAINPADLAGIVAKYEAAK